MVDHTDEATVLDVHLSLLVLGTVFRPPICDSHVMLDVFKRRDCELKLAQGGVAFCHLRTS